MPSDDDILFGELAMELGLLAPHQVKECLDIQKHMAEDLGMEQSLGEIMASKGYLTREDGKKVHQEAQKRSGKQVVIGPYEMIGKIGQGGMGEVYKARVQGTGAVVAMKILPARFAADREFVARFHREAEIACKLDHPNIVRAIEASEDRGHHYFVMEYVEGESVWDRLKRENIIPEAEALRMIRKVAMALQHAFRSGLVHRDVKPDNIFLASDGEVKLGDMGMAKETDQEVTRITQTRAIVGTPYYMAPEQARASHVDHRCDIYSLGATLYHMVTGQVPFEGTSALAIINQHLHEELPYPADINDDLTDEVCDLISKMMAKDPDDRYQTPLEFIHDLDLVIQGETPESDVLPVGKSSIRKAVKMRDATELAERRRRRLEADRRRSRRAGSVAGVPAAAPASGNQMLILGVGLVAVLLLIVAVVFWTAPDESGTSETSFSGSGPIAKEPGEVDNIVPSRRPSDVKLVKFRQSVKDTAELLADDFSNMTWVTEKLRRMANETSETGFAKIAMDSIRKIECRHDEVVAAAYGVTAAEAEKAIVARRLDLALRQLSNFEKEYGKTNYYYMRGSAKVREARARIDQLAAGAIRKADAEAMAAAEKGNFGESLGIYGRLAKLGLPKPKAHAAKRRSQIQALELRVSQLELRAISQENRMRRK